MGTINLIDPTGHVHAFDETDRQGIRDALAASWKPEGDVAGFLRGAEERRTEDSSTPAAQAGAALTAGARGLTLGLSDVGLRAIGGDEMAYDLRRLRDANPGLSTGFELAGALVPGVLTGGAGELGAIARLTPAGATARLGAAIARTGEEASALTRIGRAAAGAGVEGAIYGTGEGMSDLALSDDPLSIERIAGTLSHRALFGAGLGAATGGALGGLEVGLGAARRRLVQAREAMAAGDSVPADLAALDRKGLREAERAEIDTIEAARVPERQQIATDLAAFREETKIAKPWEAVATGNKTALAEAKAASDEAVEAAAKADAHVESLRAEVADYEAKVAARGGTTDPNGSLYKELASAEQAAAEARAAVDETAGHVAKLSEKAPRWMRETGKIALDSDRAIDRLLRNPRALAERPQLARAALQQQEHALERILEKADDLKVLHATDRSGRRAAALEAVTPALERNRALQERIARVTAEPASARLSAVRDAVDALGTGTEKTLGQKMAGGAAYGIASDAARMVPGIGRFLAPFAGSAAADAIGSKLGPQLLAATRAAAERATKAIDAFATVTKAARRLAPKTAPVLASKVLGDVRFGPEAPSPATADDRDQRRRPSLEDSYDARSAEVAAAVAPGPDGRLHVRPEVRQRIGELLAPLAMVARHVADRIESMAVRRLEFVAAKMPRATQIGMTRIRPDEMAIRAWARYVAAAEDPSGIEERLADGTITPEDAEVMRELYPERMAEITRQVVLKLGELRATLPYQRRLALAIFTGAPVDASLDPRILGALQASFVEEPGTAGGTQAPHPRPAFGSVKKPEPTPAQRRAAG